MEVCGRGYVMDYCMALFRRQNREMAFKVYVTDALKAIAENTAKFVGGNYMKHRFYDFFETPEPPQSADAVKKQIKNKLKGG